MSKILYRIKPQASAAEVFDLAQKGYDIHKATRTLDFDALEDQYKAAIYRKLPEVSDLLELEQLFAASWEKHHPGELVEMVNVPQHLKMFSLPSEVGLVTAPIDLVLGNQKQLKDGVSEQYFVITSTSAPVVETNKVPENIIEEFAEVAKLDIDIDLLPLFYAQYHFQKTGELFYKGNLLWIISQVLFERKGIQGLKVPIGTNKYSTIIPKGSWGVLEGINSYLKYQITKELNAPKVEWTTASNQTCTEGLTVLPVTATIKNQYEEKEFIKYLFTKLRPEEQGMGTIPFDIPVSSLLQAFLFETYSSVYTKLVVVPERKDLVTKLNAYHAMRYQVFLNGRKNTTEAQLEYFGQLKHPASSDAAIKRGQAYQVKSKSNLLDNKDIVF